MNYYVLIILLTIFLVAFCVFFPLIKKVMKTKTVHDVIICVIWWVMQFNNSNILKTIFNERLIVNSNCTFLSSSYLFALRHSPWFETLNQMF